MEEKELSKLRMLAYLEGELSRETFISEMTDSANNASDRLHEMVDLLHFASDKVSLEFCDVHMSVKFVYSVKVLLQQLGIVIVGRLQFNTIVTVATGFR